MFTPYVPLIRKKTQHHLLKSVPRLTVRPLASLTESLDPTKSEEPFRIPVINFRKFRQSADASERRKTAQSIVEGFKNVGFVYLTRHGIDSATVGHVFAKSKAFFDTPLVEKMKLAWDDPRSNRGYVQQGRERVTQSTDAEEIQRLRLSAPDAKESMEIGRDWDRKWRNKWPSEVQVPGFKQTMLSFFEACHYLHVDVMSSVAIGLGLPETFFAKMIDKQYHNLRLLHYPSVESARLGQEGQARAGAHSDYGSLTFVFQDNVGGLEVLNPLTGEYHPATPIPATVVVNVGDLLAQWSNDVLRSTLHRVVSNRSAADENAMTPSRQSVAFFCNPNPDAFIQALPTCVTAERPRRYEGIQTEQYIVSRLSDTYK